MKANSQHASISPLEFPERGYDLRLIFYSSQGREIRLDGLPIQSQCGLNLKRLDLESVRSSNGRAPRGQIDPESSKGRGRSGDRR